MGVVIILEVVAEEGEETLVDCGFLELVFDIEAEDYSFGFGIVHCVDGDLCIKSNLDDVLM